MNAARLAYAALIPLLVATGAASLFALRGGRAGLVRAARAAAAVLAAALAALWVARWVEAGHLPLFGTYENALSAALVVMLVAVAWEVRRATLAVSPAMSLVAALLLAQGIQYDATPYGLTISERSLVVDAHAVLAWAALGAFAAAFALALRRSWSSADPAGERNLSYALTLGFVLHTAMIASGSLYKFMLFGRVWSWDPIETMALISWLAYGTLLHLSLLAGWGAQRVARWSLLAFVVLFLSYRAIVWFPAFSTYHLFDLSLKLHLTP